MIFRKIAFVVFTLGCILFSAQLTYADSPLLTPEENLWLKQRNNTIVVYPEQNNPPFTYQSPAGIIQGLSVDYIQLVADKVGARIEYLTPRSRTQIITDSQAGKGDIVLALSTTPEREKTYIFTESYVTVPFVIVVRKDAPVKSGATLADYTGKRVALTEGSAIETYVRKNFPRVVIEDTTDDEASLQQLVLGQVDAVTMDAASLSYLLSKQVLSSVKVVGNVGYDFSPAFAMLKDKEILQSILEKGLSQISKDERQTLAEKWIALPQENEKQTIFEFLQTGSGVVIIYGIFAVIVIGLCVILLRKKVPMWRRYQKTNTTAELHNELQELEVASKTLTEELQEVKHLEEDIESKLKNLNGV